MLSATMISPHGSHLIYQVGTRDSTARDEPISVLASYVPRIFFIIKIFVALKRLHLCEARAAQDRKLNLARLKARLTGCLLVGAFSSVPNRID